jgi:hypothetical protein
MSLPPNIPRQKAREAGEKFFMPEKPCKHGHLALKWVSNNECTKCIALRTSTQEYKDKKRIQVFEYQSKHREKYKIASAIWAKENKEKVNKKIKEWRQANPEKAKLISDKQRQRRKTQILASNAYRRGMRIKATPNWLTPIHKAQIQEMYDIAAAKTVQLGIKHEVDHIVPLTHDKVTGLHVPWNLQVLTASENRCKSNYFEG